MGALIPMAVGALGSMAGAATLGPAIGAALAPALPVLGGEAGAAALAATTGLSVGDAAAATGLFGIPSAQLGQYAGGALGGLGGTMIGKGLAKGFAPEATPIGSPPSFPNSRGVQAPDFKFQTVGIQPSATIGAQRGGDILELLRRLQTRA